MAVIPFGILQGKLMASEKYSPVDAAILTEAVINSFDEDVREIVFDWAEGNDVTSRTIDDIAVSDITDGIGCTVFQALCIINAARKKPECFDSAIFNLPIDEVREAEEA